MEKLVLAAQEKLVLAAHKCRGKREFEIAIEWSFGTPSDPAPWYILQATGHRIFPYWTVRLDDFYLFRSCPEPPEGHRDFYDSLAPRPATKPLPKVRPPALSINDL